ncbi:MAG: hypothetical protein PHU14_01560 [Methylovulum sp.]|nr:hypothetical protein [Methylovulum sp.]
MTIMSQAQFAKHLGVSPSYITELKNKGALVMAEGGVDVEASQERIAQLKDPDKQGVADRHQSNRDKKQNQDGLGQGESEQAAKVIQQSRAVKEKYRAMSAKRDYELSVGQLLVADEVAYVIGNAAAVVRMRLESLPDVLAAQCAAETDEQKIRALFYDQIENLLTEMSNEFNKLSKHESA